MILPTKNIAPDRALLSISGIIYQDLSTTRTVSRAWDNLRQRYSDRPIAYSWFILALDLLFMMNLVWFDDHGMLRRTEQMN